MEKEEDEPKANEPKPGIAERLIEALTKFYVPAESIADSDDMKSTRDLIVEMGSIDEVLPYEVNKLMQGAGFKIHYNGNTYIWLLKELNR